MIPHANSLGRWRDEPCFIFGGGPSLTQADVSVAKGVGRAIAVNNAWEWAPWADILFFADRRWWEWNGLRLEAFPGRILTRARLVERDPGPHSRVEYVQRVMPPVYLSRRPGAVAGWCGGACAINLAWLLGCSPIILLGFDGGAGNWHDAHRFTNPTGHLDKHSRPALQEMARELRTEGAVVINASRVTDLRCFPRRNFDEIARQLQRQALASVAK